jgi:hypothetical protein
MRVDSRFQSRPRLRPKSRSQPLVAAVFAFLALSATAAEARMRGLGSAVRIRPAVSSQGGVRVAPVVAPAAAAGPAPVAASVGASVGASLLRRSLISEARADEASLPLAPRSPAVAPAAAPAPAPRPAYPACAPGRLAGSGSGFCQIN